MLYPSNEYTYVDENGQNVEPSRFIQHFYTDNNEQTSTMMNLDENLYDNNQQEIQYRPIVIDGSQPL